MMERMILLGANKEDIEVSLVGGSNVLKRKDDTICQANINSVLEILNKKNIKIRAKSLGGTERRSILFDTKTGEVFHSIGNEKDELLSCF
jgi:chemotaxis receptor (MCP) glutamine deamidase CheD